MHFIVKSIVPINIILLSFSTKNTLVSALKCGGIFTTPCMAESDIRYDKGYTNDLTAQSESWAKDMVGWSIGMTTSFQLEEDGTAHPASAVPFNVSSGLFGSGDFVNLEKYYYMSHSATKGSRFARTAILITAPVCIGGARGPPPGIGLGGSGGPPPGVSIPTNSSEIRCATQGKAIPYNIWGASTYEKDGTMRIFKGNGIYGNTKENFFKPVGDSSLNMISRDVVSGEDKKATIQVSGDHIFYGDGKKISSISVYNFNRGNPLQVHSVANAVTSNKAVFLKTLEEAYNEYNIPEEERILFEGEADTCVFEDKDKCVTDEDYCTIGRDPNCSESPYQEPPATLNGLGIGFISIISLAFLVIVLIVCRKIVKDREAKRFKNHFMKQIVDSMTTDIWDDNLDIDDVGDVFKNIDSQDVSDGLISQNELGVFLQVGEPGKITERDFNLLFKALDIDNNGTITFLEFSAFLAQCKKSSNA